jgi:hypothetical protein
MKLHNSCLALSLLAILLMPVQSAKAQILIDVNLKQGGSPSQTGVAVLGISSSDSWNNLGIGGGSSNSYSTITDINGTTLSGVSLDYSGGAGFGGSDSPGGTAMDSATTPLMESYVFSHGGTLTFDISGLSSYIGDTFTLVTYAAGDSNGQGSNLTLTAGGTGGNTSTTLTTSATDRKISIGLGDAYNTFTGTLSGSTLTVHAAALGGNYNGLNGFQLQLNPASVPEPSTYALLLAGFGGLLLIRRIRRTSV